MVKNLPSDAGDTGLIPGRGTKIPHTMGQLGPTSQLESPCAAVKVPCAADKTRCSQTNRKFFKKREMKLWAQSLHSAFLLYTTV